MSGKTAFSALRALISGTPSAAVVTAEDEDNVNDLEPVEGEEEDAGDPPAGDPPADDEPAGDPPADDDDAPPQAAASAADFKAGVDSANKRWAAVILDPKCRANLEAATTLIVETDLSAARIAAVVSTLSSTGGDTAALQLLDKTPKPEIGLGKDKQGNDADAGATARKNAVASVNRQRGVKKKEG